MAHVDLGNIQDNPEIQPVFVQATLVVTHFMKITLIFCSVLLVQQCVMA